MMADLLTRWLSLVALAVLVGSAALSTIVPRETSATVRQRLARWSRLATAILLLAGASELVLRARTMTGGDLGAALAAVPSVLGRTHFGRIWIARGIALGILLRTAGRGGRAAPTATIGLALAVALSTSLVGHAADQGDVSLATVVDWVHVSAAAAWIGGLFCLAPLLLPRAHARADASLLALVRSFSILAGWSLALVVASGAYNGWVEVSSLRALWTTAYGRILVTKVALVLAVAGVGATNRYRVLPALAAAPAAAAVARLARFVAYEAALGLAVLACTALLTESSPPRHRTHDAAAASSHASVRCFASAMKRTHESAHALHMACVSACLRHSFSQSSQTSRQAAANSPRRDAPSVASWATAPHAGSISATRCAHAASDVSPDLNMARQCARHRSPSATHARAASISA
jgi:putative copper export protein